MNLDFLYFALAAGLGIAMLAGPLGSLMVWQRMAYFGDTLAHGALLGVAIGLWLSLSNDLAVLLTCLGLAGLLIVLQELHLLATDTLLGILSHTALALGLVALALIPGARVNMEGLLFGDLLAISKTEVITIWVLAGLVLAGLGYWWRQLVAVTVHEDLAQVEGVPVRRVKTIQKLMLATVVAVGMKVAGVLLITALLIIPAASARRFSHNPEQMAILGSVIAALAVLLGLTASWFLDTPAGPSIVLAGGVLFGVASLSPKAD
ncbi:MAG: metal ABC transporter permease [Porticoccaceae bacterium]